MMNFVLVGAVSSCLDQGSGRPGSVGTYKLSDDSDEQTNENDEQEKVDKTPVRPTNKVYIKSGFCACEKGKPIILGDCLAYCAENTATDPTLFVSTRLDAEVELMFGNLTNWCQQEIDDGNTNPNCFLRVRSEQEEKDIVMGLQSSNKFKVNIQSLQIEKTYTAKIVVVDSGGTRAQSESFQIYRKEYKSEVVRPVGPLKIMQVSQYHCLFRAIRASTNNFSEEASHVGKVHYFFVSNTQPPPIPLASVGQRFYYCHDVETYGVTDRSTYDRLGLVNNAFNVWDQSDLRFYDTFGTGKMDINILIEDRIEELFGITAEMNLFTSFNWPNYPLAQNSPIVGFYMVPWTDPSSGRTFCPKQADYNSTRPEFQVLKEFVGVDTEGLYFSKKDPETVEDENGTQIPVPDDYLLINENLLKKIWFYMESGTHIVPDDITAAQKTIHFYWPPVYDEDGEPVEPYLQKSTQRIYTVISQTDSLGPGSATSSGARTSVPTSDKRFGCIPAL